MEVRMQLFEKNKWFLTWRWLEVGGRGEVEVGWILEADADVWMKCMVEDGRKLDEDDGWRLVASVEALGMTGSDLVDSGEEELDP